MGCYRYDMDTNLLYTIILFIYMAPVVLINIVAYRIIYLRMQLENEYPSYE
jgi:hypothetical protein